MRSSQKKVQSVEKTKNQEGTKPCEENQKGATGLKKFEERRNRRPTDVPARKCNTKLLLAVCLLAAVCPCCAAVTASEVVFTNEELNATCCGTTGPTRAPVETTSLCPSVQPCRFTPQQFGANCSSSGLCSTLCGNGASSSLSSNPCSGSSNDSDNGTLASRILGGVQWTNTFLLNPLLDLIPLFYNMEDPVLNLLWLILRYVLLGACIPENPYTQKNRKIKKPNKKKKIKHVLGRGRMFRTSHFCAWACRTVKKRRVKARRNLGRNRRCEKRKVLGPRIGLFKNANLWNMYTEPHVDSSYQRWLRSANDVLSGGSGGAAKTRRLRKNAAKAQSQTQMLLAAFKGFLNQQGGANLEPLQELFKSLKTKPKRQKQKRSNKNDPEQAQTPQVRIWNQQVYEVCPRTGWWEWKRPATPPVHTQTSSTNGEIVKGGQANGPKSQKLGYQDWPALPSKARAKVPSRSEKPAQNLRLQDWKPAPVPQLVNAHASFAGQQNCAW